MTTEIKDRETGNQLEFRRKRSLPFGASCQPRDRVIFVRLGRGILGVADSSKRRRIRPGEMFSYCIGEDGEPHLYRYRVSLPGEKDAVAETFPYSLLSTRHNIALGNYCRTTEVQSVSKLLKQLKSEYPDLFVPSADWFVSEWQGLRYENDKAVLKEKDE